MIIKNHFSASYHTNKNITMVDIVASMEVFYTYT
jgi:hypothetical protein